MFPIDADIGSRNYLPIHKQQRGKCMILCARTDTRVTGQMRQEGMHVGGSQVPWMPHPEMPHESTHPVAIRLLGSGTVVFRHDAVMQHRQQSRSCGHDAYTAIGCCRCAHPIHADNSKTPLCTHALAIPCRHGRQNSGAGLSTMKGEALVVRRSSWRTRPPGGPADCRTGGGAVFRAALSEHETVQLRRDCPRTSGRGIEAHLTPTVRGAVIARRTPQQYHRRSERALTASQDASTATTA